jgi:ADP-heptose:LPS heptosyltransferase/2-polyprenyl-3-methyl-5-hydroxy-6-metoxy-1,4-benzoquinol methylase
MEIADEEAMTHQPLVSCIMPTFNRGRFVAQALRYFARQDYPNRELIVIDDGGQAVADTASEGAAVRYIKLDARKPLGEKRNIGCAAARGEIIVHWDDDDWQAPWRVSYQVRALLESGADVCGLESLLYFDPHSAEAWRYIYPPSARRWVSGNTLCYRRSFWERHPFPHLNIGEDARFVWQAEPAKVVRLEDSRFITAVIHPDNASPKAISGQCWSRCSVSEVHALLGDDLAFYASMQKGAATGRPQSLVAVAKGIGDILRATPLIRVLHLQGYDVDVLIDPDYAETALLLEGAPEIRRLVRTPPRETCYDLAAFTYWAAKYVHAVQSRRTLTFNRQEWLKHGDIFCITQIARAAGWNRDLPPPFAIPSDRKFDLPAGTVALHPGCKPDWPWKKWHGFAELARLLPHVAIIGTAADMDNRGTYFQRAFDWPAHAMNFASALTLKDTAALLKQCSAVVSNDSGIMHLAAALGTPTFGIFGITSPAREAVPLGNMFPVTKGLDCEAACREQPWGRRDCDRHLECLKTLAAAEVHQRLVPILPAGCSVPPNHAQKAMDRVTLVYHGHPFDATGYGTAARAYIHALHRAGVEVAVRDLSRHPRQVRDALIESLTNRPLDPDFHLFHGIPPEWARDAFRLSNAIGMTVWETDSMPTQWRSTLNHVLETWLPCDFNVDAFRPQLSRPVFKLPHPVIPWPSHNGSAQDANKILGTAAGDFVIYSIFEWQDRKFPEGQLAAYLRAFPDEGNTIYLIKSNPGAHFVAHRALAELRGQTGSRARVELRCEAWSEEQIEALHCRGDCYLSLHRGEGWAYPLFEAVCRGKPAVATAHSGPLEYLSGDAHALIRWSPVTVRQPYVYYNARMKWAEPDVGHAAEQLRFIVENQGQAKARAADAADKLRSRYAIEAVGQLAQARLVELLDRTNRRPPKERSAAVRVAPLRPPVPIPGEWFDADYFENGIKSNWRNGYNWRAFEGLFSETAAFLTSMFPNARSFLDVGCAKGFLVRSLRDRGAEAWGFDTSKWAIDHADPKAKEFVTCASTDSANFDRTFDVIVVMDLLTQLTEDQAKLFLSRARAWTRIGLFATISAEDAAANGNRDFSHVTRRDRAWWHEVFLNAGWRQDDLHCAFEQACQRHDLPRRMNWRTFLYAPG